MNNLEALHVVFGITAAICSLLAPLMLLIVAILKYSINPPAMRFVIAGSMVLLLTVIAGIGLNLFLSRAMGVEIFSKFVMVQFLVTTLLQAIGLLLIGAAAFVDRGPVSAQIVDHHVAAPAGGNPYQSGPGL